LARREEQTPLKVNGVDAIIELNLGKGVMRRTPTRGQRRLSRIVGKYSAASQEMSELEVMRNSCRVKEEMLTSYSAMKFMKFCLRENFNVPLCISECGLVKKKKIGKGNDERDPRKKKRPATAPRI
jgi:hypothetical protein